jgi:hypothetical protein
LLTAAFVAFFHFTFIEAVALTKVLNMFSSLVATLVFAKAPGVEAMKHLKDQITPMFYSFDRFKLNVQIRLLINLADCQVQGSLPEICP